MEEVRERFEACEKALEEKDVPVLDNTFWNSSYTVRLAMSEHGYGSDAIHTRREARPPGSGIMER